MKYIKKMPQTDPTLSENLILDGWTKIKEPHKLIYAILLSIPFMIVALVATYFIVYPFYDLLTPIKQFMSHGFSFTINLLYVLGGLAIIYLFIVFHEILHAIMIPKFYKSEKTFWGLSLQGGFIFTAEELSKRRFYLISILPYFTLSVFFPVVLGFCGLLNGFLLFLITVNALGSSVDFLNIALITFQVPNGCRIINNGFETFYK